MDRNVVYVANGEGFVREAAASMATLWRHNPELDVTLVTDLGERARDVVGPPAGNLHIALHDSPEYTMYDKIDALIGRAGTRTLFLDTDTYVCGDLSAVFEVLDRFDVAAVQAWGRPGFGHGELARVPETFPEFNTGVIAFRNGPAIDAFFGRWKELAAELRAEVTHDQPAFRLALYESELRPLALPPEFNFRVPFPGFACGPVKILHGRSPNMAAIERDINRTTGMRVYIPGTGVIRRSATVAERLSRIRRANPRLYATLRSIWHRSGGSRLYRMALTLRQQRIAYRDRPLR